MPSEHSLFNTLQSIGFSLPEGQDGIADQQTQILAQLNQLSDALSPLFERSKAKYPEHTDQQLLLGLFTLHHEKQLQQLRTQQPSLLAMQKVIDDSLDKHHAQAFKSPLIVEIWLTMHLWLFVQGQSNIDYSLAYDYANETAELLSPFSSSSSSQLRSEWLKSFYVGKEKMSKQKRGICYWITRLLRKSNQ
ncbi:hypothetical protein [Vibrio neonatus]|uniref:hypothetical protein n=1 Tax=Vibrio neonatus TaxID=278860 RepID=UPI0021C2E5E0|nr:hypothetical protein [Vibrio neonatus]